VAEVVFRGVTKRFDGRAAVDRLDLEVADGELLVLLGPSGCGKTTALRMVAGLEDPDEGEVAIGGRAVNDVDPKDRDVAMVFQSYALYPHMSVERNIEFPLRQRAIPSAERSRRVHEAAASLGLDELLARKPRQLSGGQRQRVALARAIVRQPQAFLMDEPLSNLDAAMRLQTRADIVALQARLGTTTLYVTHDQVEAMTMGHRIAVLERGVLQQVDTPERLYQHPANTFVARFLGSPGMNLLPATIDPADAGSARVGGGHVPLGPDGSAAAGGAAALIVGVRPEHVSLSSSGTLEATVLLVELLGAEVHVLCRLADDTKLVLRQDAATARPLIGDTVRVVAAPGTVHVFTGESGGRLGGPG
jgi:multiple sugar transport system ATP-binding protein